MTTADPIVIVGAARTPMGGFLGDLKDAPAPALGARAISRRGRAGRDRGRQRRRNSDGLRAAGGAGPGAGATGRDRRWIAARGGRDDHQQDVRLGHEGGHGRPRPFARRLGGCRRRRRHGEHEQRALSARSRALGLPHGPRPHDRSHVSRRARGRLRQGSPHGDLRRGLRGSLSVHAEGAGRLCR